MANRLKDAFKSGKDKLSDAISNVVDNATAGDQGLTGPELEAARAHGDFADMDDLDTGTTQVIGDPDTQPPASLATPVLPLTASVAIDGLAKEYILKGYEALQRTPNPDLSDNFRAQLLHFRNLVNTVHKAGVRGPGKLTAAIIGVLAVDQRGKIDAITFLRQIMRQGVWQASVDVARWRRAEEKASGQRRAGEEDGQRGAPIGMDGMSDHSDAIAGVTSSSEAVLHNEADVIAALVEVNGYLSAFADTICDDENDRLYLGLESGLSYIDKPGLMAGSWVGVYDVEEALDIQMIKNQESLVKRDEQQAERRRKQLALLAQALG